MKACGHNNLGERELPQSSTLELSIGIPGWAYEGIINVTELQSGDNLKHQNTLNHLQMEAGLPIYYLTTPQPNGGGGVWAQRSSPG